MDGRTLPGGRVRTALPWLAAALLALLGAALALLYAYNMRYYTDLSPDEQHYIAMARRLLETGVYSFWGDGPDSYVTPGFPLFLTAMFALFGSGESALLAVRVLQCLLTGGTVFLVFLLARSMTGRASAALIAAALVCFHGGFAIYSRMMLTENIYFFWMMLSFFLTAEAERRDSPVLAALAGLAFGVTVMIRSLVVSALLFLLLPRLLRRRRDPACSLLPVWLFLGGVLLVCLPWWIRNLAVLHRWVFWTTQTNPIYAGLLPDVQAAGLVDPGSWGGNFRILFRLLAEHPKTVLSWMSFGKFQILFMNNDLVPFQTASMLIRNITVYLGLAGAVLALLRRRTRLYSLPFWFYFICIFFSVPTDRYSYQYLLLLSIFAGWLLTLAWDRLKELK